MRRPRPLLEPAAAPIVLGYLPVAFAFGVTARAVGLPGWAAVGLSVFVYAGASQFLAIHLVSQGGPLATVLAVALLNTRMAFEGLSLLRRLPWLRRTYPALLLLTDEVFVTAAVTRPAAPASFVRLAIPPYLAWIAGTLGGVWVGNLLPHLVALAFGVGLDALFVSLLVQAVREEASLVGAALLGAAVSWLGSRFIGSAAVVVAMVVAPLAYAFLRKGWAPS
jgi:4-azaleucine resistance transporter AzlC